MIFWSTHLDRIYSLRSSLDEWINYLPIAVPQGNTTHTINIPLALHRDCSWLDGMSKQKAMSLRILLLVESSIYPWWWIFPRMLNDFLICTPFDRIYSLRSSLGVWVNYLLPLPGAMIPIQWKKITGATSPWRPKPTLWRFSSQHDQNWIASRWDLWSHQPCSWGVKQ